MPFSVEVGSINDKKYNILLLMRACFVSIGNLKPLFCGGADVEVVFPRRPAAASDSGCAVVGKDEKKDEDHHGGSVAAMHLPPPPSFFCVPPSVVGDVDDATSKKLKKEPSSCVVAHKGAEGKKRRWSSRLVMKAKTAEDKKFVSTYLESAEEALSSSSDVLKACTAALLRLSCGLVLELIALLVASWTFLDADDDTVVKKAKKYADAQRRIEACAKSMQKDNGYHETFYPPDKKEYSLFYDDDCDHDNHYFDDDDKEDHEKTKAVCIRVPNYENKEDFLKLTTNGAKEVLAIVEEHCGLFVRKEAERDYEYDENEKKRILRKLVKAGCAYFEYVPKLASTTKIIDEDKMVSHDVLETLMELLSGSGGKQ